MHDDTARKLEREMECALDGLTPIEKALLVAEAFREVYGDAWSIEAKADGGFSITRVLPDQKKTL
jgi:hypothetical protein